MIGVAAPARVFAEDFVSCVGPDCTACDLMSMGQDIVFWLSAVLVIIATGLVLYAGYQLAVSVDNAAARNKAKELLTNSLIGLVIVLGSWFTIDTVMKIVLGDSTPVRYGMWWQISCAEQDPPGGNVGRVDFADSALEDRPVQVVARARQVNTRRYVPGSTRPGNDTTAPPNTEGELGPSSTTTTPAAENVTVNDATDPIFDCTGGEGADDCSHMVRDGAVERMQETLEGPFATLQENYGEPLVINDAIAKDGTSREQNTPGSRHFFGDALDVSIAGMSNADQIRLYEEAKKAGFTGFGFGNNILHMDRGQPRGWDYGNSTYGGQSTGSLISSTYQ
jgi:hypothetical protein